MDIKVFAWRALLIATCWPLIGLAQTTTVSWYDGQQLRTAWVDEAQSTVALAASTDGRRLQGGVTLVTEPGQADAVRGALDALGLEAATGWVSNRVYVHVAPTDVLATTLVLQGVPGIQMVRLQWMPRIAAPAAPQ